MTSPTKPFNVTTELAKLQHEKKNQNMHTLPPNATVQRRPINHAPIASPFAGSAVQKVVYVSSKTPFMSAVKRVKRLLREIEKRATQDVKLIDRGERAGMRRLAEAREQLSKDGEEVLVKASGRAMERALRVGEWFRTKEKEINCKVEVRTGSVSVVDDVVEVEDEEGEPEGEVEVEKQQEDATMLEGGDTTLELLGPGSKSTGEQLPSSDLSKEVVQPSGETTKGKKRKRRKKKRPSYDPDDLPEQRLRWVKTVEVAISLKA